MIRSRNEPASSSKRTLWIVLGGLAILAGLLTVASSAQAQPTIDEIHTYTWGEDYDTDGDTDFTSLDQTWTPIPHDDAQTGADTELAVDGFALVRLEYTANGADRIHFDWVEHNVQNPARFEYTFTIDQSGDDAGQGHAPVADDEQNVFLARDATIWHDVDGENKTAGTGPDGCGAAGDPSNMDLRDGTPSSGEQLNDVPAGCYFFVEIPNENSGDDPVTGTGYVLEVEVEDDDGQTSAFERDDQADQNQRPVTFQSEDVSISSVTIQEGQVETADGSPVADTIEAGDRVVLNLTVSTGASSSSRTSADGDVDAWACIFRTDQGDQPYVNFDELHTPTSEATDADEPVPCEVMNHPGRQDLQPADANAVALTDTTGPQDRTAGERHFELRFQIDRDEMEMTSSAFIDSFDFRFIVRDLVGNVLTENRDNPLDVGRYEVDQTPLDLGVSARNATLEIDDFLENEGCFQPDVQNQLTNACYRSLNFVPPYDDQPFTFPIILENYGNLPDEVVLDWISSDEDGETDWTVQLVDDGGAEVTDPLDSVTVPAGTPTTSGPVSKEDIDPGTRRVQVQVTPTAGSQAGVDDPGDDPDQNGTGGYYTARFDVRSGRSDAIGLAEPSQYLEARLVQNAQGKIALGDDGTTEVSIEVGADDRQDVTVTVTNTGNTDGPFNIIRDDASPAECSTVNDPTPVDENITLTLRDDTGSQVDGATITPGQSEEFTLRFDVGTNVPIGDYHCVLDFEPFPGDRASGDDDAVSLITTDPTVVVSVIGQPDINIWEARGTDLEQINVTGDSIHLTVPPTAEVHEVYLYLENVGDVALEPELISPSDGEFLQNDRHNLGGTWLGVNETSGGTLPRSSAAAPFSLPVSDGGDKEQVRIRDLFTQDREPTQGNEVDSPDDPWLCSGRDSASDSDTDKRILCQIHWRFDVSDVSQLAGDRVTYLFRYQDAAGSGDPAEVEVTLDFQHVGTVEATSVTQKVLGTDDETTIKFDADLIDATQFDSDASQIDATLEVEHDTAGDCGTASVQSSSESLREATFRPTIDYEHSTQGGCTVSPAGGDITVTAGAGTLKVKLIVTDDNGSELRQVHPVRLKVQQGAPGTVQDPSSFEISPSDELDATGSQWARVVFDPGNQGDGFPSPDEDQQEGLLLTRKTASNALEPFPDCSLDGEAVSTDDTSHTVWTVVEASPARETIEYTDEEDEQNNRVIDAAEDIRGLVLANQQQDQEDTATTVGNVTVWGWGDGSDLTWREGWNPLVMRLVDDDGDPARGPDASSSPQLDLELRFLVREGSEITDSYELSTDQDTIRVQNLGNGVFDVDVYLPATVAGDKTLGDYNTTQDTQSQEVFYEAFGLHASIGSGQSTSGEDLRGDAYWQMGDLGLIETDEAEVSSEEGTLGPSAVEPGIGTFANREKLTQGTVGPDDQGRYLHASAQFIDDLMKSRATGSADWATGPGVQDYGAFLMEETSDPQDASNLFGPDAADGYREHTFRTYTNADIELTVIGASRINIPGGGSYTLEADDDVSGLYRAFFVLPDTGLDAFNWLTEVVVSEDQQDGREFFTLFRTFRVNDGMEPSTNGLPMPLCLRAPLADGTSTTNPVGDTKEDPAGDFDDTQVGARKIVDLRTVPGLLVDRGGFAMAPLVANGNGGVSFDVNPSSTFRVLGQGLLSIDASEVPTTGEIDVPISLSISPKPASAVGSVEAELTIGGSTADITTLTDADADGTWTGSVTPVESGDHNLTIRATDTGGSLTVVQRVVNVTANAAPRISIDAPVEVDGTRAISPTGTVEATITDRSITASAITYEEKIGSAGPSPQPLDGENVSIDGLQDRETPGEYSLTLTFPNQTDGNAWINITGGDFGDGGADGWDDVNGTAITDGEATGTVLFNTTGSYTLTVQTNGTDGVDHDFDVTIEAPDDDGFSTVDVSDALSCQQTTCTLSHAPSGLSDGDTYQFRITAEISADDKTTRGPISVEVDGTDPTVDVTIGDPKIDGTTPRVSGATSIEVEASDNTAVESITVRATRGGTETGSVTLTDSPDETTISELGLTETGSATIEVNVTDIAGNQASASVSVRVDASGPQLTRGSAEASGANVIISVTAVDEAGVDQVQLFSQAPGETRFTSQTMTSPSGDTYEATVSSPGGSGTLEYYIEATDDLGNDASLGSSGNALEVDLSQFNLTNSPPSVSITSPTNGASVSGTVDLVLEIDDPDGDTVSIEAANVEPTSGNAVPIDVSGATETIPIDTTQLPEGRAIIEVEVSDGRDTDSASISVIVNNLPDAGACEEGGQIQTGPDQEVCFTYEAENVTSIEVALIRNGETIATRTLEPQASGTYRTTFDFSEPGSYALRITASMEDGSTEETTSEPFQVQGAVDAITGEPLGRFITTLVLGVVTVGLAAFAAFGRWDS